MINKSDLGVDSILNDFKKYNPIYISLKREKNLDKLIIEIKNRLKNKFINSQNILITRERHRYHLEQCAHHLRRNLQKKKNS